HVIADFFDSGSNDSVIKIKNLNSHQVFSVLDGEATYSSFILSSDIDRNGLDDFIAIHRKSNTTLVSRENSVGLMVLDDYVRHWHYELSTYLAQPNGKYIKEDATLDWEKLPYAISRDEFDRVVFPMLGDFNGDGLVDFIVFHMNQIVVYSYDSLYSKQSGKNNKKLITYGDFIRQDKQYLVGDDSKNYPYSLSGDINNDGVDDVLLLNNHGEMLHLLGNVNGVFRQYIAKLPPELAGLLSFINPHRTQLQLADLNQDGILDLVIILNDGGYYQSLGYKVDEEYKIDVPLMVNKSTVYDDMASSVHYRENKLAQFGKHRIISISHDEKGENRLVSLSNHGQLLSHPLRGIKDNDISALFDLGGGDDIAAGYNKKKNIFTVGEGYKQYQGGENQDTFILTSSIATKSHILTGGAGSDTVALGEVLGDEVSSVIDINDGHYSQIEHGIVKRVAYLYDFENILGNESVNDEIIGNDLDNYLNGIGGDDSLSGNGGDDLLALQEGLARGGAGKDSYHILKNTQNRSLQIKIEEIAEDDNVDISVSNIFLEHNLNQIVSIELDDFDVLINLSN
ncbi:FG-GAP-like repeat-containing protein, partial [Yersinia aleksiciae]|uniref:FG-GAP-like repeat-containing protein n=1 Tax=Yersinia aleksiciae TaxID=263819 RepID=UPI001643DE04